MIFNMSQGGKVPKEILEAQTITPGTSDTVLNKDSYLNGDITIPGDADLLPENIRTGVDIFGVTGNVNSAEYGIIYNAVDADGNPTDVSFRINHVMTQASTATYNKLGPCYKYLEKIEIICDTLLSNQFGYISGSSADGKKIKLKCRTIQNDALAYAFSRTAAAKLWISDICETIDAASAWGDAPFGYSGVTEIYCESAAKKDGWGRNWNTIYGGDAATTYYGITEAAFDAL